MVEGDGGAVSVLEVQIPSPWSSSLIEEECCRNDSIVLVATADDDIIGWCCSRVMQSEAELLKLTVREGWRRRSIGNKLLETLEKRLLQAGVCWLFLEVRSANFPAISFYRRVGFTQVGMRINYYSQPKDDALIFKKPINHLPGGMSYNEKH